jgi:hypothetical protein
LLFYGGLTLSKFHRFGGIAIPIDELGFHSAIHPKDLQVSTLGRERECNADSN